MADITNSYYPGDAFTGYGSQLLVGQGEPTDETFVAIADLTEITPGDMTTAIVDKTHLRSPEAHREKLAALRDSGPFALTGNWRPMHGSQSNAGGDGFTSGGLIALWRTRAERNFKIVIPTGTPGAPIALTTLTQAAGLATATAGAAHGLVNGAIVTIGGATPAGYNGTHTVTVTTTTAFTFPVSPGLASPATGTITAVPTDALEWPFRGVVSKFQPGTIGVDDKVPFSAEVTPLQDSSAALP
jgi:hypothetical protein